MKLNFITDQGSILASTSWARRVGAVAGVFLGAAAGTGGGTGLVTTVAAVRSGATVTAGRDMDGLAGLAVFLDLSLGLVRAANDQFS